MVRTYQLDGVSVPALRGVSLTIHPGDYVAIIGPSGSGKSTLMHLLGGLDQPSGGRLVIGGRDVASLSAPEMATLRNETIGFVFQSFHLLPRTSAVENVALPLVYRGVGARQRRERAAAMLGRVGLGHRLDHRPNQLSGGEQQRVAIARALVTDPAVLLADEPTGNLDSVTGESVLTLLEELNVSSGVAVVLVTHDREVAQRAARQILIRDGVIQSDSAVVDRRPPAPTVVDPTATGWSAAYGDTRPGAARDRAELPRPDPGRPGPTGDAPEHAATVESPAGPEIVDDAPSGEPRSASGSGPGHPTGGSGGAAGATGGTRSGAGPTGRRGDDDATG